MSEKLIGFFYTKEDPHRDEGEVVMREVRIVDGDRVYSVEIPYNGEPITAYVYDRSTETMIQHREWDRA